MSRVMRGRSAALGLMMSAAMLAAGPGMRAASAQGQSPLPSFIDERRLPGDGDAAAKERQSEESLKRLKDESDRLRERLSAETEARRKAEEEAARKKAEEESADKSAAEAEQERARQAAEAARKAAEEEAAQKAAAEQERARQAAEAAARKAAEEEAAREAAAERERARQAAEAAARKAAEEEAAREAAAERERARQAAEAAARKAAEEEAARKVAAERERARQAAEAAARKAAEEEAARKAAAEQERARRAAEAAARKAAEEEAARKAAAEQERARQAAEAAARKAAEQEAARKTAAERTRQATDARRRSAADDLAQRMSAGGSCKDVQLESAARPAGRLEIKLHSACLAGRDVTFAYAGHDFTRTLPDNGELTFLFDLFEGKSPLALKLDDGTSTNIDVSAVDLSQVSKVAVLWSAPVNLDLHALEYLAPRGSPGHVWAKSPASLEAATAAAREGSRGRGFLSMDDPGTGSGTHAEVYTFLHNQSQRSGAITLLIDYETRGDTPSGDHCGQGRLAVIEALVVRLRPGGKVEKETVRLGPAPCGEQLPESTRFNSDTLSDLLARG